MPTVAHHFDLQLNASSVWVCEVNYCFNVFFHGWHTYVHADIDQLLIEAKHRWLRPAEICEILRNYPKFQIASEPPDRPSSMISTIITIFIFIFFYCVNLTAEVAWGFLNHRLLYIVGIFCFSSLRLINRK